MINLDTEDAWYESWDPDGPATEYVAVVDGVEDSFIKRFSARPSELDAEIQGIVSRYSLEFKVYRLTATVKSDMVINVVDDDGERTLEL